MLRFILTRFAMAAITFLGITALSFFLIRAVPGDPVQVRAGERGITPERHAELMHEMIVADTLMGKGVPFLEQREKSHFIRVEPHEWQLALAALEAGRQA